jgi:hypothetical protein
VFGLPPFDALVMVCDARRAEQIPWLGCAARKADRFTIEGKTYGQVQLLSAFLAKAGYDRARLAVPESKVVVADRDYFCPKRARVVIVAGCAYGASGYLARLHWRAARVATKNFLWFAHTELDGPGDAEFAQLAALHAEYLAAVTRSLTVTYFASDGSIEIGGRHVCRGSSAVLLRECVRLAQAEGRMTFRFREFKRIPWLISHPKNTGFETRLSRLRSALAAADCGVSIEPRGRGQFALVTACQLELVEESGVTKPNPES